MSLQSDDSELPPSMLRGRGSRHLAAAVVGKSADLYRCWPAPDLKHMDCVPQPIGGAKALVTGGGAANAEAAKAEGTAHAHNLQRQPTGSGEDANELCGLRVEGQAVVARLNTAAAVL